MLMFIIYYIVYIKNAQGIFAFPFTGTGLDFKSS